MALLTTVLNSLLNPAHLHHVTFAAHMTPFEKTIVLIRISIYFGLVLCVIDYRFLLLPISAILIFYAIACIRQQQQQSNTKSSFSGVLSPDTRDVIAMSGQVPSTRDVVGNLVAISTSNNPYMNAMPFDNRNRCPAPENITAAHVAQQITQNAMRHAMVDATDIYYRNTGDRQFYTMPCTTYPNNQGDFARWLYGSSK
jgi:preprotein translocase subunit YajC